MKKMKYRRLGNTGIEVSEIGYGAWGIGGKQWLGGQDDESLKALQRSFELGVNFVDTALAYGDGHSEQLVGKAVRNVGRKIHIATKIPPKNRVWPATPDTPIDEVFPYEYIIECTDESLRNLGVEQIDLQQFHVWTDAWTKTQEWRRAIQELKKSGKVRHFGISISEHEPDTALEAMRTGLIETVQVIYNIFDQTPEQNLFPLCQELNIGVLARVPLDEGGLTGTITPDTQFEPTEFRAHYFRGDRKQQVVEHVKALEKDLVGVPGTLPEIALRFCFSHPAVSTVIPGMRRLKTVESSCAVSDLGPLSEDVLALLRKHAWFRNFYQ
jgi:aryl-alcohol dehydrogenase-like predicted oxidoreductase